MSPFPAAICYVVRPPPVVWQLTTMASPIHQYTPEIVEGEGQSHPGEHSSTRQEIALWDFERPPKMMSPNPSLFLACLPPWSFPSPPLPFLMRYPPPPPLCLHNHAARSSPQAFSCLVRPRYIFTVNLFGLIIQLKMQ